MLQECRNNLFFTRNVTFKISSIFLNFFMKLPSSSQYSPQIWLYIKNFNFIAGACQKIKLANFIATLSFIHSIYNILFVIGLSIRKPTAGSSQSSRRCSSMVLFYLLIYLYFFVLLYFLLNRINRMSISVRNDRKVRIFREFSKYCQNIRKK